MGKFLPLGTSAKQPNHRLTCTDSTEGRSGALVPVSLPMAGVALAPGPLRTRGAVEGRPRCRPPIQAGANLCDVRTIRNDTKVGDVGDVGERWQMALTPCPLSPPSRAGGSSFRLCVRGAGPTGTGRAADRSLARGKACLFQDTPLLLVSPPPAANILRGGGGALPGRLGFQTRFPPPTKPPWLSPAEGVQRLMRSLL